MKALILAGGFGTRLGGVLRDVPKPMAPVLGKPFLEHQIRRLKEFGITEFVLAVHHMSDKIKSYFGNGLRLGVDITYSEEDSPLGTAGAIKKAQRYIDDTFLVLNGDSYFDVDINKLLDFHKSKSSKFTIALTNIKDGKHSGNVALNGSKITGFIEKPEESGEATINAGVYIFEPIIFDYIEPNKNISLEKLIFPKLATDGLLYGMIHEGYFIDIGRPESYKKFREDSLISLFINPSEPIRNALQKMDKNGTDLLLVVDERNKLLGAVTSRVINVSLLKGSTLEESVEKIMIKDPITAKTTDSVSQVQELLLSGTNRVPILDENGIVREIEFRTENVKQETFPLVRGRAPLRISFAGGGTDLPYFFEKYGGVVISATIDKYCHASILKRGDSKIIINSDLDDEVIFNSQKDLIYDGRFDIIKSVVNIMKPDFGFELYLHNDIPPGRGLGSSATLAVLLASLLSNLQDLDYDEYKIADIAYRAERDELKIKGGWQDQYAAVMGGFNFMEFNKEKNLIYPLKIKPEIVHEFNSHLTLCYVGESHFSSELHAKQEANFSLNEDEMARSLNELKELAAKIKDSLLLNDLENIGKLMHESWVNKRKLNNNVTNSKIDRLYEIALQNGVYGGRLLGAGGGGYLLFFHSPKIRNNLKKVLEKEGGEVVNFSFEFNGTSIFPVKSKG